MEKELISVVIPVYNVEKYVRRCFDSVLSQSYENIEIIIVDDGSTDGSPRICDEYSEKDGRVKVIHKENGGLSSARNSGISVASGRLITFIDSDDFVAGDYIEQLYYTMSKKNADISICSFTSELSSLELGIKETHRVYTSEQALKAIFIERPINTSAWGKLFRTDMFKEISFPQGLYYEDYATAYLLFHKAERIAFADSRKYFYTQDNLESITKAKFSDKQMDYFKVGDKVLCDINRLYPSLSKYVSYRNTNYAISFYRMMAKSGYCGRDNIKEVLRRIRHGCVPFLFSKYPIIKRLSGLVIAAFPKISAGLFKKLNV